VIETTVLADAHGLAHYAACEFLRALATSSQPEAIHVCLTGGRIGIAMLAAAATLVADFPIDWPRTHFWWSDERFVPRDDPERNAGAARAALLDLVPVPVMNVHEMPAADAGMEVAEAATSYGLELGRFATASQLPPPFTVAVLGLGSDGHIASIFPDHSYSEALVQAVLDSPKPPPVRLTLSLAAINSADEVWLLASGAEKAEAVLATLNGAPGIPAALAKGRSRTRLLLDAAAAAQLP
jgi:6-phosphogluconolactonase